MTSTGPALSRESRARPLAVLILGLLGGLAPLAASLPPWIPPLVIVLSGWRVYLEVGRRALPSRWFVLALAVLASAAVLLSAAGPEDANIVLALLVVLTGVKLLETRSARDRTIAALLGYFIVLTDLIYRPTLATAAFGAGVVVILTAALVEVADETGSRPLLRNVGLAARMLAQAAPVAGVLFLLFPRIAAPLWGAPREAPTGPSGLSDTMAPGSVAELALSEGVAFRASFKRNSSGSQALYWRGPVLERTDGTTWTTATGRAPPARRLKPGADAVEQLITLEPSATPWLPGLDTPVEAPAQGTLTSTFALRASGPVTARLRYRVVSCAPPHDEELGAGDRARALQVPPHVSARVRALALELRRGTRNDAAVVDRVLRHFREEAFFYTLKPGPLGGDPVDQFLFQTKRGFCEHYAAAFTVLLRLAGVPSRVVTGYLGGEWNPLGEYWIVRQSDAHAWSEVWLEGLGWHRVDPTAAVAPGRIERRNGADVPGPLRFLPAEGGAFGRWVGLLWDSANDGWNQWILGYGVERQRALLTRFGFEDVTWAGLTAALAVAFGALIVVAALRVGLDRRVRPDPALALYLRYCRKLARCGLPKRPQEGHRTYAARVCSARPDLEAHVRQIAHTYEALRYRPALDPAAARETLRELRLAVRRLPS